MYAHIENTDMIADTFAEWLGGLVTIIGQNISIRLSINKALCVFNPSFMLCISWTGYIRSIFFNHY